MQALIIFFVELCALRRAPQDLPASEILLGIVALANLVIGGLVGLVARVAIGPILSRTIAVIALTLLALYGALRLVGRDARFMQSATALLGSEALIGALMLIPLSFDPFGSQETELAALGALLFIALIVWGLVVTGHILRHTFEITLAQGAAIAFAFKVGAALLVGFVFGGS